MGSSGINPRAEELIAAFCRERRVADTRKNRFGKPSDRLAGISDGNEGPQWNAWLTWDELGERGFAGVNLEGLEYGGRWPVGRFIERELTASQLFQAISTVQQLDRIEVIWYRDAWQVQHRPEIRQKFIPKSPRPLSLLGPEEWHAMLIEASQCLGRGMRGRTRQEVERLPQGVKKEMWVSPHFQFRRELRPADRASMSAWQSELRLAFAALQPLYDFVSERSRTS